MVVDSYDDGGFTRGNGIRVDRMADLQEKIDTGARKLMELRNELEALPRDTIQEAELAQALEHFSR